MLSEYLLQVRPLVARPSEPALFLTNRKRPMTRQGFWLLVKKYAVKARVVEDMVTKVEIVVGEPVAQEPDTSAAMD